MRLIPVFPVKREFCQQQPDEKQQQGAFQNFQTQFPVEAAAVFFKRKPHGHPDDEHERGKYQVGGGAAVQSACSRGANT